MSSIAIVGGVYGEECAFPYWKEIYGSAGRAAVGLSSHVEQIELHTMMPIEMAPRVTPNFESFGIELHTYPSDVFISFDYLHCLADPTITPRTHQIKQQPKFEVHKDVVVMFGMMESCPRIVADICIYDPQSPIEPRLFRDTGSEANRLAVIANSREIELLTGLKGVDGATALLAKEKAEIVISKCGMDGAILVDVSGQITKVPAYETKNVFTIGSGDIFVAAFSFAWAIQKMPAPKAAEYASKAVAQYVENSALPILSIDEAEKSTRNVIRLTGGEIYLAGPFRELGQRVIVNEARKILRGLGLSVFSPVHDIGHGPPEQVVAQDLKAIDRCDAVLAIMNGSSPGTVFEVGYAVAKGKPVYCVAQNMRSNDMKLPIGAGCIVHQDFISALHLLAWRK